jgi:hypothetical protein
MAVAAGIVVRHGHGLPILTVQLANSLGDELVEERMRPQRGAQNEGYAGMSLVELIASRRQVPIEVHTSGKEIRDHQHTTCASLGTSVAARFQLGLGQLEKARFDDRVGSLGRDSFRQCVQIVVGGLLPTAVCDQEDGCSIVV